MTASDGETMRGDALPMIHTHAFLMRLYGEKRFILFSPDQSDLVYPDPTWPGRSLITNPDAVDLENYPLFSQAVAAGTRGRVRERAFC